MQVKVMDLQCKYSFKTRVLPLPPLLPLAELLLQSHFYMEILEPSCLVSLGKKYFLLHHWFRVFTPFERETKQCAEYIIP